MTARFSTVFGKKGRGVRPLPHLSYFCSAAAFWSISALSTQKKVNSPVASSLPPSPVMSTAVSTVDFPRCRTQAEARTVPVAWLRRKWSALVCVT